MRYICFLVVLLFVAPLLAADADSVANAARSVVKVDPRSGRLVRKMIIPSISSGGNLSGKQPLSLVPGPSGPARDAIRKIAEETALAHSVDPLLVHSVIAVESNYNRFALSPKGAEGLMQLIPSTARRFGVRNPYDPKENIEGGVKYLKYLQELFNDDRLAIAAYNAGEGAVFKYKDIPPYQETIGYVTKVGRKLGEARAKQLKVTAMTEAAGKTEEHRPMEQYTDADGLIHLRTR